jgi:hypothetical protein
MCLVQPRDPTARTAPASANLEFIYETGYLGLCFRHGAMANGCGGREDQAGDVATGGAVEPMLGAMHPLARA